MDKIKEMALNAYPKILYCQEAYEKGARDIMKEVSRWAHNALPPFYQREFDKKYK